MNTFLKERISFYTLILIITIILFPAICFSDANRIFKENNKAVVVIVTYDSEGNPISQGSGFIIRKDGVIVTNYHVISNARGIKIKAGKNVLEVEGILYMDKENDIVILKAKAKELPIVKLGNIDKTEVGENVYVISSPLGLENTISEGILSGKRDIDPKREILQITAPISEGSSGSPVFNKNGEVIGIATFVLKEAQNLNFAMPINLINDKISAKKVIALKEAEIEDYKKTAEYWFILGCYYGEAGLFTEAIDAFKQAIRIKPDYVDAHVNLGVTYGKSGMYKEAIESCKQAIRIEPDCIEAYGNLGNVYSDLGMNKEAIEFYKQVIRIRPDDAKAHYNLGIAYVELGMYREAIEAFKQAIRIKPDYAWAHGNLGIAYVELGMYREAIEAYKQVIRIKPDDVKAHLNLGSVYVKSGKYTESLESYKQAIRIKPDYAEAYFQLGIAYLILNDRGSALNEYKILKDLDPQRANDLFNLIYK